VSASTSTRPGRYGFLTTPRWLVLLGVAALAAATMVGLGFWQLSRYQERTAINERIEAAGHADPRPVTQVLGPFRPPEGIAWTRVRATGEYDPEHEILIRGRTVSGSVGFEVITPLVLDDGSAVLVDRGWVPPGKGGATALPDVPAPPTGEVTVVGRVHLPESGGDQPAPVSGQLQARRVDPARLASALPYPVLGGYLLAYQQEPPSAGRLAAIPVRYEESGQNLSYLVQWWLFAVITLAGTGFLARREARQRGGS
jgi:cytochrome oxidase assembly protein ShyY1